MVVKLSGSQKSHRGVRRLPPRCRSAAAAAFGTQESPKFSPKMNIFVENFDDSCFPTKFLPNPTRITPFNMIIRSFQYDHQKLST